MDAKKIIIKLLLETQDGDKSWAIVSSGYGNFTSCRTIKKITNNKKLEFSLYISRNLIDSYLSISFFSSPYSSHFIKTVRCREEEGLLELIEIVKDKLLIK